MLRQPLRFPHHLEALGDLSLAEEEGGARYSRRRQLPPSGLQLLFVRRFHLSFLARR